LDLNGDSFDQCLKEKTYGYVLNADIEMAREYGIHGVPSFLINGELMVGSQGEDFFKAIDSALADAV